MSRTTRKVPPSIQLRSRPVTHTWRSRSSGRRGFIVPVAEAERAARLGARAAPSGVAGLRAPRWRSSRADKHAQRRRRTARGSSAIAGERGQRPERDRGACVGRVVEQLRPEPDRHRHRRRRASALGLGGPAATTLADPRRARRTTPAVRWRAAASRSGLMRAEHRRRPEVEAGTSATGTRSPPNRVDPLCPPHTAPRASGTSDAPPSLLRPVTYEIDAPPRPAAGRSLPSWPTGRPLRAWQQAAAAAVFDHSRRRVPRLRDARRGQDHVRPARRPPDALRGARGAGRRRRADDPHLPPVGAGRRPLRHRARAQPAQLRRAGAARPPRRRRHVRDGRGRRRRCTGAAAPSGRRC